VERRGTLIVRVWVDEESSAPLLARVVEVVDEPVGERTIAVVASAEAACEALRRWLANVAAR
jgi:hypothetical protein